MHWYPNGTIIGKDRNRTRLVFMETDLFGGIVEGVSEAIGFNIESVVVEAERRIGRSFIETLIPHAYQSLGLYHFPRTIKLINPSSSIIFDHVAGLGYGRFILLSYKFRKRMTVLCRNPYNPGMLLGDSLGTWEFLEQKEGAGQSEMDRGMLKITLEESRDPHPHLEDRLKPVNPVYTPGRNAYDLCPGCGLPSFIGRTYRWDLDEGVITDHRTGQRVACLPVASLEAVFRELEEELGQEIPGMVLGIAGRKVREFCAGTGLDSMESFKNQLTELPLRGMGNPRIVSEGEGACEIAVDNPMSHLLIEGILSGCLASIWRRPLYCRSEHIHGSFTYIYRFNV